MAISEWFLRLPAVLRAGPGPGTEAPVLVIGAGGHAKVLVGTLLKTRRVVRGLLDSNAMLHGNAVLGRPILGDDQWLEANTTPALVELVNGVGSTDAPTLRQRVYERHRAAGYRFSCVIDTYAFVAPDVVLGEGAQVMAGAVIQAGSRVGKNAIINSGAIVEHDCVVGDHSHIAPGAVLSGGVKIASGCHIGTGATIIQAIAVGYGAVIAAGAVVVRDVEPGTRVFGCPAKPRSIVG